MRARRLVLNGLTAEEGAGGGRAGEAGASRDSLEFYHELEIYRQLLALPPPATPPPCTGTSGDGGPASVPPSAPASGPASVPPSAPISAPPSGPASVPPSGPASVPPSAPASGPASVRPSAPASAHVLRARAEAPGRPVGDAARMALASQTPTRLRAAHPSAPTLWSKEVVGVCGAGGGGGERGMVVRAPASLPGLYPHGFGSGPCDGGVVVGAGPSPSSSEESTSPTEVCSYRRLGERAPLMRRLARGLGAGGAGPGGLLLPSDDDSTPLVADTPTTPTNAPLCLNGGYLEEAGEAAARARDTRHSNREPPLPAPPPAGGPRPPAVPSLPAGGTPRRHALDPHMDLDFNKCNNFLNNCSPGACGGCEAGGAGGAGACSRTSSSSSGGSSRGASRASGNNNPPRAEPELTHAPWFQQGIPREIALEVLGGLPVGAFLVRGSTTQPGSLALSVRVPAEFAHRGIAHYLILRTNKGYKIKGFTKEFTSLCALVTHHSVMPELLPVPLRLARAAAAGVGAAGAGELADLDALAPRPPPPRAAPPSLPATPRRARTPARSHHATPHHVAHFLTQLDV